jgi:nitric oxide reductase NorD protein
MTDLEPLESLRIADPDTYVWVRGRVLLIHPRPSRDLLEVLAGETIHALSQEPGLGRAVAEGLLRLIGFENGTRVPTYVRQVRQAGRTGPTLARLLAIHLVPVLVEDETLLAPFTATVAVMRSKGTYTLSEPLEVLTELLQSQERGAAAAYLDLLNATFSQVITYNYSVRLVYLLPKAVRGFVPRRRTSQIEAFIRVVRTDLNLADAFLEGMQQGVALLGPQRLTRFLDQALHRWGENAGAGAAFISLSSLEGRKACADLQVAVPLAHLKGPLDRYLNARLGRAVTLKPISAASLPDDDSAWICSDGWFIFFTEELDRYTERWRNQRLAKLLVRLEAGCFEFGTFTLDLERAADLYPAVARQALAQTVLHADEARCEAERFFACFKRPELAEDLFALFEHARLLRIMAHHYPGLAQQALAELGGEIQVLRAARQWDHLLAPLYSRLTSENPPGDVPARGAPARLAFEAAREFDSTIVVHSPVEACAQLVCITYPMYAAALPVGRYRRFFPPFGRRLRWDLVRTALDRQAASALRIKLRLAERGWKVYRSDLQHRLSEQGGRLSADDITTLILSADPSRSSSARRIDLSNFDLEALVQTAGSDAHAGENDGTVFYYHEWDEQLRDYLRDHVRVQETMVAAGTDGDFYQGVLDRYRGLVARVRRAFEFLKPEGLVMLRQWPEGDDFDYRALIDFALDVRAGRIASDRLYVKRLKQQRDVAALLLVDMSRSTANPVIGGKATVLTVAKEALVLFCEALQVVGDTFAIAGFSGTGRHSVDYFRIKDFDELLGARVQQRISALRPQRSTRMGAAIRHAVVRLAAAPARVRLMIVVSDGFPNDLGYKAEYAIADTRRAVQEARAREVHVKAITVNIGSDPRLDDLYGRVHHHVIADVRDLPDKLLQLYGTLTKRS